MYTHQALQPMRLADRGIDEYTLAAYLAGRLSSARRNEIAEFLRSNEDARDLLYAANQLMESEGDRRDSSRPLLSSVTIPPRRKPVLTASRRLGVLLWTSIVLVCLTAFTTTVVVAFRSGVDRGLAEVAAGSVDPSRMIALQGPFVALNWTSIKDAARYQIVVWDDETAGVVGQVNSDVPTLDFEGIAGFMSDDAVRRVWIDAFDAEGRLLERSRSLLLQ
ncbi:MAG: hypothetical protein ACI9W4_000099 [Rhodothermales bacterium]|jgi:hypothetical protein